MDGLASTALALASAALGKIGQVTTELSYKLTTPSGKQGQILGFVEDDVVGAMDNSSGGSSIVVSSIQPTDQKVGDLWYKIIE